MKLTPAIVYLTLILLISSCTSTYKIATVDYEYIMKGGITTQPILADMEVKTEKIKGSASVKRKFIEGELEDGVVYVKNLAIANAIDKVNADVMVQPIFRIEIGKMSIEADVSGFPGYYKSFRNFEIKDTTHFYINRFIDSNSPNLVDTVRNK